MPPPTGRPAAAACSAASAFQTDDLVDEGLTEKREGAGGNSETKGQKPGDRGARREVGDGDGDDGAGDAGEQESRREMERGERRRGRVGGCG